MGGLLAFRVDNFDNTAEREQFRFLCSQLSERYENSNDFCVFAGNYNIGCELDALFIKRDAIIVIEFKNYGGHIVANENGEWVADGAIIKGGSRKTVLQQARINHSIIKRELKVLGVEANQIKDVPTLIVFNQPIVLENNLSATNKSWLHITDNDHFIEKLDDITSPKTNLSPLGIVQLAELLNLNPFYLAEFSNASCEKPSNTSDRIQVFEDIKRTDQVPPEGNCDATTINLADESQGVDAFAIETVETKGLYGFVRQVLDSILKKSDYKISIYNGQKSKDYFDQLGINIRKTYLIKVESKGVGEFCSKISRFINQDVRALNADVVCWQDGDDLALEDSFVQKAIQTSELDETQTTSSNPINFHKYKTILPHWLDRKLFQSLEASYSPEHERYEYNLDLNKEELKVYLGTYFPRSYAESFCTFDDLFKLPSYFQELNSLSEIRILDYGCGTGGELFGLLVAISKHFSKPLNIIVYALDGNSEALGIAKSIFEALVNNTHHNITASFIDKTLFTENDLITPEVEGPFNIIMNSKMVCELISKGILSSDGYSKVATALSPLLAENGILYMLDVTTKDEHSNLYYPQLMNKSLNCFVASNEEFSTLIPLACANWTDCNNSCFIQQTFIVSHSHKSCDESRVCYRLLCKSTFKEKIMMGISSSRDSKHIIHPVRFKQNDESSICPKSKSGNDYVDSYKITQ